MFSSLRLISSPASSKFIMLFNITATLIALALARSDPSYFKCTVSIQISFLYYLVMDLKICSLNVRGLGDRLKRRETFNWSKKDFNLYAARNPLFWKHNCNLVIRKSGLDTNFLHHFPLWKVDFKFYFPSQNFTIQNGLQFHIC